MTNQIRKCPVCGSYGLSAACPCGAERLSPKPPKYSPEDRYAKYRRQYKAEQAQSKDDDLVDDGTAAASADHRPIDHEPSSHEESSHRSTKKR